MRILNRLADSLWREVSRLAMNLRMRLLNYPAESLWREVLRQANATSKLSGGLIVTRGASPEYASLNVSELSFVLTVDFSSPWDCSVWEHCAWEADEDILYVFWPRIFRTKCQAVFHEFSKSGAGSTMTDTHVQQAHLQALPFLPLVLKIKMMRNKSLQFVQSTSTQKTLAKPAHCLSERWTRLHPISFVRVRCE